MMMRPVAFGRCGSARPGWATLDEGAADGVVTIDSKAT